MPIQNIKTVFFTRLFHTC